MGLATLVKSTYLNQSRCVKRLGVTADLTPATAGRTLFTISGDPIIVEYIFGVCVEDIGGGAARPFLQLTANAAYGAGVAPICALSASIAAVNAGELLIMTGVAAGLLTAAAVPGIKSTAEATGLWGPATGGGDFVILVPGIVQIVNTVSAVSGLIDWFMWYKPCGQQGLVVSTTP